MIGRGWQRSSEFSFLYDSFDLPGDGFSQVFN